MSDSLPLRALRHGLRAARRAGAGVVARVLQGAEAAPFQPGQAARPHDPRESIPIVLGGRTVQAARGATLLEVANLAGIDLRSYCGGNCSCGSCRVEVRAGAGALSRRAGHEELVLGADAARRGDRLACQAQVLGPVEIHIPEWF